MGWLPDITNPHTSVSQVPFCFVSAILSQHLSREAEKAMKNLRRSESEWRSGKLKAELGVEVAGTQQQEQVT
jgi:hypothetical protein